MDFITVGLVTAILGLLVHWLWNEASRGFDVFEKQGIPFMKPTPYFGTILPLLRRKVTLKQFIIDSYNAYPEAQVVGNYDRKLPVYLIRDTELIKKIGVKDFEHFIDHRSIFDVKTDPLLGNNLVNLTGEKWKDMRATLSPVFTGSKMRQMFDALSEYGVQFGKHFEGVKPEERVLEMKDVFTRFTLDVIAATNFGVKIDSLADKENSFYKQVLRMLDTRSFTVNMRFLLLMLAPKVVKFFRMRVIPQDRTQFFVDLVRETEQTRKERGIFRPDLVNMLMQLKTGQLKPAEETTEDAGFAVAQEAALGTVSKRNWTDEELLAQAFIFFFAGFETISTAASFIAYELALNPAVQQKLIDEIDGVDGKKLTYEALQQMKYLDMVVSEGLRFWPPADLTDRVCVKDFKFLNDGGREVTIAKGSQIWIPIVALHFSEKFYENPQKFDPERFSDENKHRINREAYIPFGVGPRNCIGSRFALMELKVALFYLLRSFRFEVSEKTEIPLKLKKGFGKQTENGIWLKLEAREK